jgi:hypothetical protein
MALKVLRFISLSFAVLGFAVTFAHVLQIPGQRALDAAAYLQVAHTFYGGYAVTGAVAEIGGLVATLLVLYLVRGRRVAFTLTLIAVLCPLAMLLFFFVGNAPLNAQIATWTLTTLPSNWESTRDVWSYWHAASCGAACIWVITLLLAALRDTVPAPDRLEKLPIE